MTDSTCSEKIQPTPAYTVAHSNNAATSSARNQRTGNSPNPAAGAMRCPTPGTNFDVTM